VTIKRYTLADGVSIVSIRKARKEYTCPAVWAHDPKIRRGELYARVKVTPGMGAGWRDFALHVECAEPA
jgi:hypothetical protein